jgi:hypothetical protein
MLLKKEIALAIFFCGKVAYARHFRTVASVGGEAN